MTASLMVGPAFVCPEGHFPLAGARFSADARKFAVYVLTVSLFSNLALLLLQQVSFRLLAPVIGSSVETWSTTIAMFLGGIALGSLAGGHLADRHSPNASMRVCLMVAGVCALWMNLAAFGLKETTLLAPLGLRAQIVISTFVVCFPVSFALSLLTPLAVKGLLGSAGAAGRVAGIVYAVGTVGSLVGNFVAGFWLIPTLDINTIVFVTALALLLLSLPKVCATQRFARDQASCTADEQPNRLMVQNSEANAWQQRMLAATAIVTIAGFVSGALESLAFRMIAPLTGCSLFLTTGVVGVVLAGIALGNYLGGRLAAAPRGHATLRGCLVLAGVTTCLIVPLLRWGMTQPMLEALPLIPKILFWSLTLFFLPSLLLGTVSPQVIQLVVDRSNEAGRISGRLYAWSTLGCIAGILSTSWIMIEWLGTFRFTAACGLGLLALAYCVGERSRRKRLSEQPLSIVLAIAMGLALVWLVRSPYALETKYFSIRVIDAEKEGRPIKQLVLDQLVHSETDLSDPQWLGYKHMEIQGEIAKAIAPTTETPRILVIGGGGYNFPRWVESSPELASVAIDVVEIDPGVTEMARRELGLSQDTRIASHHLDGRQFLKQAPAGKFDLVVQDAVNDYSVPYHLMSREYNELVSRSLRPEGVYLLTVIDSLQDGPFIRAALRTMQTSFREVRVLSPNADWNTSQRSVYVIAGFSSSSSLERCLEGVSNDKFYAMPMSRLAELLSQDGPHGTIFTDSFAPVDFLMARTWSVPR